VSARLLGCVQESVVAMVLEFKGECQGMQVCVCVYTCVCVLVCVFCVCRTKTDILCEPVRSSLLCFLSSTPADAEA
jgi:hypothetical protein